MNRSFVKKVLLPLAFLTLSLCMLNAVGQQDTGTAAAWPEKDVTITVPFSAGGVTDLTTRVLAQSLEEQWGVNVNVENRPGGSSLVGIGEIIYRRPADGYHIVCNSPTVLITQYTTDTFIPFSDYTPVCKVVDSFCTLSLRTDLEYKTMEEFFDAVKKAPGKFTMAGSGTKSIWYALMRELEEAVGLKFSYVPYDGGKPAATAVAGGHVDCCLIDMATILSLYQAGTLNVVGYFGPERNPAIPDAKTAIEIGYPDLTLVSFFGFVVPNGVDQAIVDKISEGVKNALKDPKTLDFFERTGGGSFDGHMPQDEYIAYLKKLDSMYKVFFAEE